MMKQVSKKENLGITLIALVITIIILLILAGITIAQLTGSGLFENAKLAKEKSENAQEKEDKTLADFENKIGQYIDGTRDVELTQEIKDYIDSRIDSKIDAKINEMNELKDGTITKDDSIQEVVINKFCYTKNNAYINISISLLNDLGPGESVVVGNINEEARPTYGAVRGVAYYGTRGFVVNVKRDGEIEVRNIGTETLKATTTQSAKLAIVVDYNLY